MSLVTQAQGREPITAKLAANLLTEAGSDRVIVCDIHSTQALGYFDIPVDHIYGQVVRVLSLQRLI
jgi:ribose-phosphate pyrophosphokinase